jgi:glycosyltransferase involved in cell wall biosynthesis
LTTPAVTVLMAVHNAERYLREAVESILEQSFRDFELVVVDDGSTDGSRAILDTYEDTRLRVLSSSENHGLTISLNRGLREARGTYVARQDADDISEATRLERQVAFLDDNPKIALLGTAYHRIDENGRRTGERTVPVDTESARWRLLFLNAFPHTSVMVRRAVLLEVGPYDERYRYAQDYELWSRIAALHDVAGLEDFLVSYRSSSTSMTATYQGAHAEAEAISRLNLRTLLVSGDSGTPYVDPDRFDRETAWRILFGGWRGVDAIAASRTSREILALQTAFGRYSIRDSHAARRHRARIARSLTRRLARLAVAERQPRALAASARTGAAWAGATIAPKRRARRRGEST